MARNREFYIKVGDTAPAIEVTCKDSDGDAVDVSGSTVRFHMKARGASSTTVDAAATIVDGPTGVVKYQWVTADTDTAGDYLAEFEVTYTDGTIESFPNRYDIQVFIRDQIA